MILIEKSCKIAGLFWVALLCLSTDAFSLTMETHSMLNGKEVTAHQLVAVNLDGPDYDWWYGCSPTSAGMMMGYYDINGYDGLSYNNLVPSVTAETTSYGNPDAAVNQVIASNEHIAAFYSGGFLGYSDDTERNSDEFNSLSDFMGTSQDAYENVNGGTTFWYYTNGSRLYAENIFSGGPEYYESSGMYGLVEYMRYAGYDVKNHGVFNQYTDNLEKDYGFTFEDYMNEIDAGRVVLIHITDHTMLGYGYTDDGEIILHDTWDEGEHYMDWGGSYGGGDMFSVTCLTPAGGSPVPIPGGWLLLGCGLMGLLGFRKKFT